MFNPTQTGLFSHYITGREGRGGGGGGGSPHRKFFNFQPFDFKLSTILLDQHPKKKIKMAEYFDDVILCAIVVVWTKKFVLKQNLFWGPRQFFNLEPLDFKLDHLTSNFPRYFFDKSLIRIRKKIIKMVETF